MRIKKTISISNMKEPVLDEKIQIKHISSEECLSMLEEIRYDMGKITGYDYSRRFKRLITYLKR